MKQIDEAVVNRVAVALWKAEAERVRLPSYQRTAETFALMGKWFQEEWQKMARAAITAYEETPKHQGPYPGVVTTDWYAVYLAPLPRREVFRKLQFGPARDYQGALLAAVTLGDTDAGHILLNVVHAPSLVDAIAEWRINNEQSA